MHELSVCQALIAQVEELAQREKAQQVECVRVGIGPLSGVEPQLLQRAYPLAAAGTLAEGSVLDIEDRPVRVNCQMCGKNSDASANRLLCAHCGDWRTTLISGDELILVQVEFTREEDYV
ncbi:MAG TPA: hydrogenase maturation nickel metallochaperone HypA [Gammaproteobacteria bacterium]|nr:hydrogenase maturation nickel metallochaperone HypA [Gammaproteobacteria bacterium]